MTWDRAFSLYVDVTKPGGLNALLDGKTSDTLGRSPTLMQGDKLPLRLFFRTPSTGGATTAVELPAGGALVLAAKATAGMNATRLLFSCDSFAADGTEDDLCYVGTVDLNTEQLETALQADSSIEVNVDIEVQTAGNAERSTFRFVAVVYRQTYSNEGAPTSGSPVYPVPSLLVLRYAGSVAIDEAADEVEVDLSAHGLAAAPSLVLVSVRKPAGGANLFATVREAGLTASGFTADLSAAAPTTGYKLEYLVIV